MKYVTWGITLIGVGASVVIYAHASFATLEQIKPIAGNRILLCKMALRMEVLRDKEKLEYCIK